MSFHKLERTKNHHIRRFEFSVALKNDRLGRGTVRVELKLRFTGYRLRFTVSKYGLKKQHVCLRNI